MKYEAVHPFTGGWQDLQRRMASNRRVFGYFHSSLPDEPLVLLHTALVDRVPSTIDQILQGRTLNNIQDPGLLVQVDEYLHQDILSIMIVDQLLKAQCRPGHGG